MDVNLIHTRLILALYCYTLALPSRFAFSVVFSGVLSGTLILFIDYEGQKDLIQKEQKHRFERLFVGLS